MARVSLREYNQEIQSLIDNGQTDEAVAHCRYILAQFPKHVDTYRLLGTALLEGKNNQDAADIFKRVLACIPDDFISHLGMSIIEENRGDLDLAIWHMERAFEVQPANSAIQDELRRLYGQRDGVEPNKIHLTRGALARMYTKGDLYPQAIAEIRAALGEDPGRADLQVLLARLFVLSRQPLEAVETCSILLDTFPYCLEANRIMAEVLWDTERADEAQTYQQRVVELDPYSAYNSPEIPTSDQMPDEKVTLEKFDGNSYDAAPPARWEKDQAEAASFQGGAQEFEFFEEGEDQESKPSPEPELPTGAIIWELPEAGEDEPVAAEEELAGFSIQSEETGAVEDRIQAEQTEAPQEIPGWMKNAGWEPGKAETEDAQAELGREEEESPDEEIVKAEIPDWLKQLAPLEEPESGSSGSSIESPDLQPGSEIEIPSWLQEIGDQAAGQEGEEAQSAPGSGAEQTESQEADLAWLEALAARQAIPEAPAETGTEGGETPLEEIEQPAGEAAAGTGAPEAGEKVPYEEDQLAEIPVQDTAEIREEVEAESNVPDWLQAAAANDAKAPDETESLPEWLYGTNAEPPTQGVEHLMEEKGEDLMPADFQPEDEFDEPVQAEPETPAAREEESETEAAPPSEELEAEVNEWVGPELHTQPENEPSTLESETMASASVPDQQIEGDQEQAEEAPDWPSGSQEAEPGRNEPEEEEDLPDWLQEWIGAKPEPEKPEPEDLESEEEPEGQEQEVFSAFEEEAVVSDQPEFQAEEGTDQPELPEWKAEETEGVEEAEPEYEEDSEAIFVWPDEEPPIEGDTKPMRVGPEQEPPEEHYAWEEMAEEEEPGQILEETPETLAESLSFSVEEEEGSTEDEFELPEWLRGLGEEEEAEDQAELEEVFANETYKDELEVPPFGEPIVSSIQAEEQPEEGEESLTTAAVESTEEEEFTEEPITGLTAEEPQAQAEFEEEVFGLSPQEEAEDVFAEEGAPGEAAVQEEVEPQTATEAIQEQQVESTAEAEGQPGESAWTQEEAEEQPEEAAWTRQAAEAERQAQEAVWHPEAEAEVEKTEIYEPISPESRPPEVAQAWQSLVQGEVSDSVEKYNRLIKQESHLPEIIHDLNEAVLLHPENLDLYQSLGDAYLRANKLQEALDAYNKAEELIH